MISNVPYNPDLQFYNGAGDIRKKSLKKANTCESMLHRD
jgi:hypothetical protein